MVSKGTDNANISLLRFNDQSGTPATPASGFSGIYTKADGLYIIDDAAAVTGPLTAGGGVTDHGALTGLADDDHTQYALLAGRATGQTLIGGTASGEDLTLQSTAHATKGHIYFGVAGNSAYDEVNDYLGINVAAPGYTLEMEGDLSALYESASSFATGFSFTMDITETGSGGGAAQAFNTTTSWNGAFNMTSGYLRNINATAYIADAGTANIKNIDVSTNNEGAGTVAELYDVYLNSNGNTGGGVITTAHGLYVEDKTAATNNYAIYTNAGDLRLMASAADKLGFHGSTPVAKQTVTGSKGGNAALTSLMTALSALGLVIDSTT